MAVDLAFQATLRIAAAVEALGVSRQTYLARLCK